MNSTLAVLLAVAVWCSSVLVVVQYSKNISAEVYHKSVDSVVVVSAYIRPTREIRLGNFIIRIKLPFTAKYSHGSGVIIDTNGTILTAAHVTLGSSLLRVETHDGKVFRASVIGVDREKDICMAKIMYPRDLKATSIGDDVFIGQDVFAISSPMKLKNVMTRGIVGGFEGDEFFVDAAVNPGSSGGPIFNSNGEIVGIISAVASPGPFFVGHGIIVGTKEVRNYVEQYR